MTLTNDFLSCMEHKLDSWSFFSMQGQKIGTGALKLPKQMLNHHKGSPSILTPRSHTISEDVYDSTSPHSLNHMTTKQTIYQPTTFFKFHSSKQVLLYPIKNKNKIRLI